MSQPLSQPRPERIVLLRHGETLGESSIRFHGANNVMLSRLGAVQARAAARAIGAIDFDLVVASPLQRAWKTASLVAPGMPILLEPGFREIDFGCWEGLTREQIEARDPELYREWGEGRRDFGFPGGETRSAVRARVAVALQRLLTRPSRRILSVSHKMVVRSQVEWLAGESLDPSQPELAGFVELRRRTDGWAIERTSA